ncbi:MAG: polyprenol monophosphomannose synthase [Candidatus Latescibacteria bacterium]|nr:polyprenol monophosphomannose synthase [Candidatus Latescibacterota bacterium]
MSEDILRISLITPTYNERENIPILAEEIFAVIAQYPEIDLELIVVDDNSPDGTGDLAEELKDRYPIQVVHREGKLGLGSAVMAGFAHSDRELLGVIDADLSHDPVVLPQLILGLRDHDLAIGSRYDPESKVEKWPWYRKVISQSGVFFARRLTGVQDPLAGYFFLHRRVIDKMVLTSPGYKILLEILVKGQYNRFMEVPFIFRNRQFSSSKLNWTEYYLFAKQLLLFWLFKKRFSGHSKSD